MRREVRGHLITVQSPLAACQTAPEGASYTEVFRALKNPYYIKGLAGASANDLVAAKDTAMNPVVLDAFALAIIAGHSRPAFPGIAGHEPDLTAARRDAGAINRAMDELLKVVTHPGSYISESNFFERAWQQSFWGSNYPRLAAVKKKYDPSGLFFVHHGVGSEDWSTDGFTRLGG